MKKVIIIPDSFKGTLSAAQICTIISEQIKIHFPSCQIVAIPIADGGEGSLSCFFAGIRRQYYRSPMFRPIFSAYDRRIRVA